MMKTPLLGTAFLALAGVAACGSATLPAARMASAQSSIGAATAVGAQQNPTAALHLQYAQEEYTQAENLSRDGDGDRAEVLLLRAEADAQLATEITRRDLARTAANSARVQSNTPAPTATP